MKQQSILIKFKWFSGGNGDFAVQLSNKRLFYGRAFVEHVVEVSVNYFFFDILLPLCNFLIQFQFFTRFFQEKTHLQILQWCLIYSVLCCWLQAMGMSLNKHFWQFVLLSIIILWCWIGVVAMAIQCQFHILFNPINHAKHTVQIQ